MQNSIVEFDPEFPIDELHEAGYNPKELDSGAKSVIEADLKRYGFVEPIVVNRRTMTIINGHQRVSVWRAMGRNKVPVNFVDVSTSVEKRMNMDLNNPHIEGQWDHLKLAPLQERLADLPEYASLDLGLVGTGIPRIESIDVLPATDAAGMDTGGYLKVFRLHFLPDEWEFFEAKSKTVMEEKQMDSYSDLVYWLVSNYAV